MEKSTYYLSLGRLETLISFILLGKVSQLKVDSKNWPRAATILLNNLEDCFPC